MQARTVAITAAGLALVLIAARLGAQRAQDSEIQSDAPAEAGDGYTALDYVDPWALIERQVDQFQTGQAMGETNVTAFLDMVARAEGTRYHTEPYRVCYAYRHRIESFADHPAVTGEWKGEKLSDDMCAGAGYGPGCVSTAAGRYQIKKSTWLATKKALALSDFSPASQDAAAIHLINQRGALDDVKAGRIADAIDKCRREWASLPGAGYGQPERRLAGLLTTYTEAGGVLA